MMRILVLLSIVIGTVSTLLGAPGDITTIAGGRSFRQLLVMDNLDLMVLRT